MGVRIPHLPPKKEIFSMTLDQMEEIFCSNDDLSCLDFPRAIKNPRSKRGDMHAFMLLDELLPDEVGDMVVAAEHDEIFLGIDPGELAKVITEAQIIELICCGVRYSDDSLCMFV